MENRTGTTSASLHRSGKMREILRRNRSGTANTMKCAHVKLRLLPRSCVTYRHDVAEVIFCRPALISRQPEWTTKAHFAKGLGNGRTEQTRTGEENVEGQLCERHCQTHSALNQRKGKKKPTRVEESKEFRCFFKGWQICRRLLLRRTSASTVACSSFCVKSGFQGHGEPTCGSGRSGGGRGLGVEKKSI